MRKTTAYVSHSDCSRHDTGWNHPDHQGRLPALARAVYRDMLTLFEPLLEVEGRLASVAELELAHTPEHIARVRDRAAAAEAAGRVLELDGVRLSGASWDAARAAAGCVLTAIDAVGRGEVRNAFCAVRPPGGNAFADRAGGFSLFNQVAIGARYIREVDPGSHVLVLELSALDQPGTAELLSGAEGISRAAVALPEGADLTTAESALRDALGALAGEAPARRWLLLALGFDALAGDPLGGQALVPADYHRLTAVIVEFAERWCGGRLISALEGGYDPSTSGQAAVQHLRALAGVESA